MRVRALLLVAPLLAVLGAAPVQAAGAAAAAPKISPANGSVITSPTVTISVRTAPAGGTLYVDGRPVAQGRNQTLTYTLDGRTEPNGSHTVRLEALLPWDAASSTFKMAVPAATPSGLTVAASGKKVTVRWNKGDEPDLTGYTVSGDLGTKNVSAGSCGAQCSATFSAAGTASGKATVSVVAKRSGAAASGASSRTVRVSTVQTPNNPGGGGNAAGPPPQVPDFDYRPPAEPPVYPSVAPNDDAFDDEKPSVGDFYPTPEAAAPADMIMLDGGNASGTVAAESLQWGKSLAIALVLLLCAAHLGTWTRRLRTARADGAGGAHVVPGSAHARVEASRRHIAAAMAAARGDSAPADAKSSRRRRRKAAPEPEPVQDTTVLETPDGELVEELNLEYTPRPLPADNTPDQATAADEQPEPKYDAALAALIDIATPREADTPSESSSANLTEVLEHPRPRRGLRRR
ncbi:hypothetical protein LO762_15630 [Actinocorallia sp. API 0066]|uniref:Ig-like domain-containing protein n=1 Tax=Actinocorallia sp. API 0066 TaxID=2896846 RepID=UPI001E3DA19A|nr:Ig-like domain-containing protein [Actinocorallia sp. API 0066]MCD0450610.1 hypothetical protein [Actinocorallia sp. API 0066]